MNLHLDIRSNFMLQLAKMQNIVESEHKGKFLVLDLETGDYEIDAEDLEAAMRLLAKPLKLLPTVFGLDTQMLTALALTLQHAQSLNRSVNRQNTVKERKKLMEHNSPIVYCWRYKDQPFYEDQPICKIGKSIFDKFYDSCIKPALRFSVFDIEILGICLCDSKQARDKLESDLLNERFDKVRPDREFVYLNSKVRNWIKSDCLRGVWTVDFFQKLNNEYKEKHRERNREYQREKREEKNLKTRAENIYNQYSTEPASGLSIGGPTLARMLVTEDLEQQGVEASVIKEWLDELESNR